MLSPLGEEQIEGSASFITLGSPAYNVASGFAESHLNSKAKFDSMPTEKTHPPLVRFQSPSNSEPEYTGATGSITVLNLPTYDTAAHIPTPSITQSGMLTHSNQPTEHVSAILVDGVPPITDSTYGFVERIIDHNKKRSIFYAAGISELATAGAAHYVISEWEKLHNKYGNETDFLVVLRFEPQDYRRWSVIFER